MTYIPNVREKTVKPLFKGTKGDFGERENPYWEGNMDEAGKIEIIGYDWCVQQVEGFFDTIDDSYIKNVIDDIRGDLLEWLEVSRNETVVSIIDNLSDR